jgi:hypothetical protein
MFVIVPPDKAVDGDDPGDGADAGDIRCRLLKKCPTLVVCHQLMPPTAMAMPEMMIITKAASVAIPKT